MEKKTNDLISRADAIEAVFAVSRRVPTMAIRAKDALESLPSAEQVTVKLIKPCDSLLTDAVEECKEKDGKLELAETMSDYCDRLWKIAYERGKREASAEAVQGEWRRVETRTYKGECTNCGFRHIFMDGHDSQYRFCPNCGAIMKGGEDE